MTDFEGKVKGRKRRGMRYLSVCSGIEAATVAWGPFGWESAAFAEVEAFPSAVLAFHYPGVPNLGDMTRINGADFRGKIDILVGGTPCQSFSVAGLRGGLDDERGNLALEFVRIADESDPAFIVWENVPGVFSDRGNAFGCFLAALAGEDAPLLPPGERWADAGYVLGAGRAIAWRVLDAQYFGLAQRRRRVFVVACPGGGADPRKILFEFDGLRRDTPPGRETGADVAGTLESSLGRSRGAGTSPGAITEVCGTLTNISGTRGWSVNAEQAASGHLQITQALTGSLGCGGPDDSKAQGGFYVAAFGGECLEPRAIATCLKGKNQRLDFASETFVAHALRAEGFDASEDGTGRANLVPMAFHGSQDPDASGDVTHPLGTNQGREACVMAFTERGCKEGRTLEAQPDLAYALTNPGSGGRTHSRQILDARSSVRRLTTTECETLQGFPRDYTAIPWRRCKHVPQSILARSYKRYLKRMYRQRKPPLSFGDVLQCADGPRYKALGNSMAVPVMRWIGERIMEAI